ncbi:MULTISPECIES: lamin tail domain-containing protein [Nitrosococcus]|uniref:Endonuclease/exonuclease/phosphatase n=3 Tax=Nitrosococcus TaxID=1227 RepID=Q3JF75_NITOC|nr:MULTISPECIES: lamin tail domain-containing protein [Nitrosococcus]KFI17787.1 endonuclease [Nitrosococcus oceani C-27]ABA56521.1 Endonuclease/exonuclease/phosphatase [Nitrosococcus oceani ATCC 19707]ADJ29899.1 Endonuclease/exonuclease/phosphatase [Nitrosococcus watsonii C-113]EDZ65222.1 endonuclease/exonuclease/phosphatase family [Nitrosococcus oceani AFC27]BBM60796.1 endonuclease [Nitrosococcus oceani]
MGKRLLILFFLFLPTISAQAFTIASWNTKHLGWGDKRNWNATAAVVAPYDFVALQEVMSKTAVNHLVQTLKKQTGVKWSSLVSGTSVGRSKRYQEFYAFIWREEAVDYVGGAVVYLDPGDIFAREPFAARFQTDNGKYRWTAATVHVVYGDSRDERRREAQQLDEYVNWLEENVAEGDPVVLMGDFNLPPDSAGFRDLAKVLKPAIREGATTLSAKEGRYANLYDNIWYRPDALKIQEARIDRFPQRLGITHKLARKTVSDHAPVVIVLGDPVSPSPKGKLNGAQTTSSAERKATLAIICVHPDAPGNDNKNLAGEWVEIQNSGAQHLDLTGWILADEADHKIALQGSLNAGGTLRIDSTAIGRPIWNNSGDTAILRDPEGTVVSTLRYPGGRICEDR